ncbi:hypothetical protein E3P92_01653 [Wallemia ichthyophaga]|uniref:Uncharacterized protein n=2 Tax=Wallemia ichthyophaga TaxID=245174 RepID=A0A4T0HNH6_WALIC|nr:uncharacterized protein J056_001067 [Wallemia ichthyophaga EXF-994]TIA73401.1 hypothetical protein E3P91_01493 [Wallemia ichthyophaga]EOR00181.1 hypothetical protein J056_001067 [Wallemia ichthyophaga EXF-994]TIA81460.1 hypothetical protein E3P98_02023 [Wallemia ichthyophaga]TIA91714.1 hypothetical protein E3P97_01855 [Wallemia ichthyophaga]TIA96387.1 hypothetical protein E3P95_03302 [Wallemia ichthyophaga]
MTLLNSNISNTSNICPNDGNLSSAVSMGHQQGQDAQNQAKTQSQTKCLIDGTITHSYSPCSSWQPWDAGPKYRF